MPILRVSFSFIFVMFTFVGAAKADTLMTQNIMMHNSQLEYQKQEVEGLHQIVLSTPKRINNELFIEKEIRLEGKLNIILSRLSTAASLDEAFRYYESFISENGQQKFQCQQRACGVSSYWANNVYDERRLSGRDSDQYYIAGTVELSGEKYWITVYMVANALRQNLVYATYIKKPSEQIIWENGSIVPDTLSDEWVQTVKNKLLTNPDHQLYVAIYVRGKQAKTLAEMRALGESSYLPIQKKLSNALNIKSDKIQMHFVGPFHSQTSLANSDVWFRLFMYKP